MGEFNAFRFGSISKFEVFDYNSEGLENFASWDSIKHGNSGYLDSKVWENLHWDGLGGISFEILMHGKILRLS